MAWTAGQYGPGAGDTEIKIGNTMAYSGPASSYGVSYSPPKTVEQVRKMVEEDEVLLLFQTLGTPPNTAMLRAGNTKASE